MPKRVEFPETLARSFKRAAKAVFPREFYAILLGDRGQSAFLVHELWIPTEQEEFCTAMSVDIPMRWWKEAQKYADNRAFEVLGDLHSHCFDLEDVREYDASPSEGDIDRSMSLLKLTGGEEAVFGICTINEYPRQKRARFRFWPLIAKVETQIVR